jgi:Glycosyltransferase family 10 (fucosyltransferase) C-term/Alpha-(1,3)-fucosyltransferase FucT N-terminal domain
MVSLRVRFESFWPGFSPVDFFVPVFERSLGVPVEVARPWDLRPVHVEVHSVFSKKTRRPVAVPRSGRRQPVRLWYTGENIRPPASGFDATLSFDVDPYDGTNFYLPLYFLSLQWFKDKAPPNNEQLRAGISARPEDLVRRRPKLGRRPKFACAFIGNPEPTRLRAVKALSKLGVVDVFGTAVGRPVGPKYVVAADYRFMLCFENDVFPGYVTEKPFEAWLSGCVPLWNGSDRAGLMNPHAIVNLQNFASMSHYIDAIKNLEENEEAFDAIHDEGIASSVFSLDPLFEFLRQTVLPSL